MFLKDKCGRPLLNLRIAVTSRCNLTCPYCHSEGELKDSEQAHAEMTAGEISRLARIALELGISDIKLTGGEPLMRKDIATIVNGIASTPGLSDLSMTTNGSRLSTVANELRTNGLKRVNISLPTLDGEAYRRLTGGDVDQVLQGIEAAVSAGLSPVKINMLVLKDVNDKGIEQMLQYCRKTATVLQLIELEPVNICQGYYVKTHKPLDEYEEWLKQRASRVTTRRFMQNRRIYTLPGVTVEVIRPIENTDFCQHCTRLRVTSDGKLKTCLMRNDNLIDILGKMRSGTSDGDLVTLFREANALREPYNKK